MKPDQMPEQDDSKNPSVDSTDTAQSTSKTDEFDLAMRLKCFYDQESVNSALQLIDTADSGNPPDKTLLFRLLGGRSGRALLPQIEAKLKANLTMDNIALLAEILPHSQIRPLLQRVKISDEELLDGIRNGRKTHIGLLPSSRKTNLIRLLENEIATDQITDGSIIHGILRADYRLPVPKLYTRSADWCFRHANDPTIVPALIRLLWSTEFCRSAESQRIIQLAEQHLHKCEWTRDLTFLFQRLLAVRKMSLNKALIEDWLHSEDLGIDPHILSTWLFHSNCSRRARRYALGGLFRTRGWTAILHYQCFFLDRRIVRKWLGRFMRAELKERSTFAYIQVCIYLNTNPCKFIRTLAMEALSLDYPEDTEYQIWRNEILTKLAAHTRVPWAMLMAKHEALEHSDAENSLSLMCSIASTDPETIVPWIFERIESAMPSEVLEGLETIIKSSTSKEEIDKARKWRWKLIKEEMLPLEEQAELLFQLLKNERTTDLVSACEQFLNDTADYSHPCLSQLQNQLQNTHCSANKLDN